MGALSTSRFLSCKRLPCVASVSVGNMEDEEANIGALGEDEEHIENNNQRISIEDENAVAGEEGLASEEEGNIRVPTSAIPQRHSVTITNQSSWTIEGEAGVNWEAQLRRHQQKQVKKTKWMFSYNATRFQVSYQDVRKVLENISLDELEQLNQKGRSALHFAARFLFFLQVAVQPKSPPGIAWFN